MDDAKRKLAECWRDLAGPAKSIVLAGGAVMLSTPNEMGHWRYSYGSAVHECNHTDWVPDPDAPANWGVWLAWCWERFVSVTVTPQATPGCFAVSVHPRCISVGPFAHALLLALTEAWTSLGLKHPAPPSVQAWWAEQQEGATDAR